MASSSPDDHLHADTLGILAHFTSDILNVVSSKLGSSFMTTNDAMRAVRKDVPKKLLNKVRKLDAAYAVARHLNREYCLQLVSEVSSSIPAAALDVSGGVLGMPKDGEVNDIELVDLPACPSEVRFDMPDTGSLEGDSDSASFYSCDELCEEMDPETDHPDANLPAVAPLPDVRTMQAFPVVINLDEEEVNEYERSFIPDDQELLCVPSVPSDGEVYDLSIHLSGSGFLNSMDDEWESNTVPAFGHEQIDDAGDPWPQGMTERDMQLMIVWGLDPGDPTDIEMYMTREVNVEEERELLDKFPFLIGGSESAM